MKFFSKVTNFLTGGFGGKLADKILAQFPDKMSEADKSAMSQVVIKETREHEKELLELANEQDKEFNDLIKQMEGTASDLKQFGFVGRLIIFMRGMQRPIWGFAVLYMDFMVFSGKWNLSKIAIDSSDTIVSTNIASAFWVINLLVLGFLFGERAMKNVVPLLKGLKP